MVSKNNRVETSSIIDKNTSWYKNRWVWFVISIPAMAVAMSLITVYFAVFGGDTLVRDNYYKDGLAINQELDYEANAEKLGITAQLAFDLQREEVSIRLAGYQDFPDQLELVILHPTIAQNDQDILFTHLGDGNYHGKLKAPLQGRYHLQLMSTLQQWRLKAIRDIGSTATYSLP